MAERLSERLSALGGELRDMIEISGPGCAVIGSMIEDFADEAGDLETLLEAAARPARESDDARVRRFVECLRAGTARIEALCPAATVIDFPGWRARQ